LPLAVSNMYQLLVEGGEALVVFLASNPIFRSVLSLKYEKRWIFSAGIFKQSMGARNRI
jgi:hypothetical protein